MSPLALLYDVHGNLAALDAVLDDARRHGAERFVLGGDYALFGPHPAATLERLRELYQTEWIRGNVDRWTADPTDVAEDELVSRAVADSRDELGEDVVAQLGRLPERLERGGTLYCHASPVSDMRSFLPSPAGDEDELLEGVSARRVVFGHTHLQFQRRRPDGTLLLNPGSVGMPLDGDHRAAYALLEGDGEIELRRVPYDHEAAAAAVLKRFGEVAWTLRTARRLRSATP